VYAIATAPDGTTHAMFDDGAGLAHAWRPASGGWQRGTTPGLGRAHGRSVGLAVDGAGAVHVSYEFRPDRSGIHHARRDPGSGAWTTYDLETAGTPADGDLHASAGLAVDEEGGVHLAYGRAGQPLVHGYRRFCR
jgi:hypothetical protein